MPQCSKDRGTELIMDLSKYLTEDRSIILEGRTKSAALDELMDSLDGSIDDVSRTELAKAVRKRESLMSTGIGLGIAVPHVRLEGLKHPKVAVGVGREGIEDYESIDGEPVRIIVMITAPRGRHDLYIKLLAKIVGLLKDRSIRSKISEASTPADIYATLTGRAAC